MVDKSGPKVSAPLVEAGLLSWVCTRIVCRSMLKIFAMSALLILTGCQTSFSFPTPPAGPLFPGVQGFGAQTIAGRGGQILKVTNLNDSGPGSFRAAVQSPGPRIIVFEVGGVIPVHDQLWVTQPYLTIAGQTAPSPGITLSGSGLRIPTHDVLIQHIFVRHTASDGTDAIDVRTDGPAIPYNIVIDHVSISWGDDENLSFNPGSKNAVNNNVTYSNNLIAEGHGNRYGTLLADGARGITVVGNLWVSHKARQPRIKGKVSASIINNVSYNIGSSAHVIIGSSSGQNNLSFTGNVYLSGPDTPGTVYGLKTAADALPGTKIYIEDNLSSGALYDKGVMSYRVEVPPSPYDANAVLPANRVKEHVLANAGARPAERDGIIENGVGDPIDERLVNEVRSGRGSLKHHGTEMPTLRATHRPFIVPTYPNADFDGDGYSNIEELLHQMAAAVE